MATKRPRLVRHWLAESTVTGLMLLFGTRTPVQALMVPTPSMDTTIQVGDDLLVDKLVYAPASSLWRALLPYAEVKRGDVIVFKYPLDEAQLYVKRVIGVPGDRIRLILNGRAVDEPYKRQNRGMRVPYLRSFPNEAPFPGIENRAIEMLRAHVEKGELMVPAGTYFAMGDNRDNSADSRFWGFVPRENIYGKPVLVWWSYDAPLQELAHNGLGCGFGMGIVPGLMGAATGLCAQEHWQPQNPGHNWDHAKDMALHFFTKTRWERTFQRITSYPLG